jgi:hypothetical protein
MRCINKENRTHGCNAPYGFSDEMFMWICLGCKENIEHYRHRGPRINTGSGYLLAYLHSGRDDWDDLLEIMEP